MHVKQKVKDQLIFDMTKIIYRQMKRSLDQNFIGQRQALKKFKKNYIEPLYPTKRNQLYQTQTFGNQTSQNASIQNNQRDFHESYKHEVVEHKVQETQVQYDHAIKKYKFRELCFYLGIGNFICWKSSAPDPVYEDLGLGICLYLKFMKHLVYTLLILAIFPIMQIVLFYSIAQGNNFEPGQNYQKTLFAMSIGTLSLQSIRCTHQTLQNSSKYSFDLYCPLGSVRVLGPVYSLNKASGIRACKQDINFFLERKDRFINSNQSSYTSNCDKILSNCTYDITLFSQSSKFPDVSLTFQCINGKIKLGSVPISKSTALIASVIFDLIFIMGLIVFFWSQSTAQSKQQKWFKSKQLNLDQFTLQIGYFSKNNFQEEFKQFLSSLKQTLQNVNGFESDLVKHIVQVRLPDDNQYVSNLQKRMDSYYKLYDLFGKTLLDRKRDPHKYIDAEDFIKNAFRSTKSYSKFKDVLLQYLRLYIKSQKQRGQNKQKSLSVFIVFSKPKMKRQILQNTKIIRGKRSLQFQNKPDKLYEVSQPPAPALIIWENITKENKVLRNVFSWTVTLLILAATYILIAYIFWERNNLTEKNGFNIECKSLYSDGSFNRFDEALNRQNSQAYIHCYCLSKSVFLGINNQSICQDWSFSYSLYLIAPVIFSLGIVILNAIVSAIYKALSRLEAHQYLTSQLYSYIVKKTVLLVLNLALIIMVLSIDTNVKDSTAFNFLFQGVYNDITADWYLQIGLIIILSMIFNMLSPFVESLSFIIGSIIKTIVLYLFNKKPNYQKIKSAYMDIYRNETFPIEQRYAYVLAVLCICLCLNCVFPLMTIILLMNLFFLELNDKVLVIKAFQKPGNFGSQLHSKFMKSFITILILHFIVTAVLITEPFILVAGNPSLQGTIQSVNRNRFLALFQTAYVLPYIILFFLVLLSLITVLIGNIYMRTKPNQRIYLGLDGIPYQQHKFYHSLNEYELSRTLKMKKRELQKMKIIQANYVKPTAQNKPTNNLEINQKYQPVSSSTNFMNDQIISRTQNSKSILQQIAQNNLKKLQRRQQLKIQDKQKIVKLTGMTVYDWNQEWIFFDQYAKASYQIPELNLILRNTSLDKQKSSSNQVSICEQLNKNQLS